MLVNLGRAPTSVQRLSHRVAVVPFSRVCFSCSSYHLHFLCRLEVSSWRVAVLMVSIFVRTSMILPACQLSQRATWPGFHRYARVLKRENHTVQHLTVIILNVLFQSPQQCRLSKPKHVQFKLINCIKQNSFCLHFRVLAAVVCNFI